MPTGESEEVRQARSEGRQDAKLADLERQAKELNGSVGRLADGQGRLTRCQDEILDEIRDIKAAQRTRDAVAKERDRGIAEATKALADAASTQITSREAKRWLVVTGIMLAGVLIAFVTFLQHPAAAPLVRTVTTGHP